MIRLTREPIDYHALTQEVRRPECGAVITFLGTVRDLTDGKVTTALDYEAYPGMAEKKMAEIEADTRQRWPVGEMILEHRLGHLEVGEVSVAVAVSCPHRGQAFDACRRSRGAGRDPAPQARPTRRGGGSPAPPARHPRARPQAARARRQEERR